MEIGRYTSKQFGMKDPGFNELPERLQYLEWYARMTPFQVAKYIGCNAEHYMRVRSGDRWPRDARHVAAIERLSIEAELPHGPIQASHWAEAERVAGDEEHKVLAEIAARLCENAEDADDEVACNHLNRPPCAPCYARSSLEEIDRAHPVSEKAGKAQ